MVPYAVSLDGCALSCGSPPSRAGRRRPAPGGLIRPVCSRFGGYQPPAAVLHGAGVTRGEPLTARPGDVVRLDLRGTIIYPESKRDAEGGPAMPHYMYVSVQGEDKIRRFT